MGFMDSIMEVTFGLTRFQVHGIHFSWLAKFRPREVVAGLETKVCVNQLSYKTICFSFFTLNNIALP